MMCDWLTLTAFSSILEEFSQLFKRNVVWISTNSLCQLYSINACDITSAGTYFCRLPSNFTSYQLTISSNADKQN